MLTEEKTISPEKSEFLAALPLEPGQVLDDRFLILSLLREGGTSRVWKATDLDKGDLVALKIPKEDFIRDAEFLGRFRKEEEIGLGVRHRYLVAMRPVSGKSRPYLVMEYLRGETLAERFLSGPKPGTREAVRVGIMVLEALGELHRQRVVHCDVTPRNVMLCEDGTVRLMDYGIAAGREDRSAAEDWTWGTPAYMAPEQVQNETRDARTDLYSLGVVLYEMLTGSLPFAGDDPARVMNAPLKEAPLSPRTFRPDLGPELEAILLRALEREPRDRYRAARSMQAALESLLSEGGELRARRGWAKAWKGWLSGYWAEIALAMLFGALTVRIALEFRSLSS